MAAAQAAATPPEPESAHAERAEGLITATSQAEEELAELVQQDRCVAGLSLALQWRWHLRVTLNTCVTKQHVSSEDKRVVRHPALLLRWSLQMNLTRVSAGQHIPAEAAHVPGGAEGGVPAAQRARGGPCDGCGATHAVPAPSLPYLCLLLQWPTFAAQAFGAQPYRLSACLCFGLLWLPLNYA